MAYADVLTSSYPIVGDSVPVTLTLTDVAGGNAVEITVAIPEGSGDLLGLFGNVTNEAIVPQLAFSRPLLVAHGWDPFSILRDAPLMTEPLADARYGQILRDLVASTNAIYRPILLTYNSRLGIIANGQKLAEAFRRLYPDPPPEALLSADLFASPSVHQSPKAFRTFDSFGFSMGGLVNRTYQLASYYSDPPPRLPNDEGRRGRIQRMVSMGTPHHGALQVLRIFVALAGTRVTSVPIESVIEEWSPGTTDLLDYVDEEGVSCFLVRNATLCELNRDRRSAPHVKIGLIAGTKSTTRITSAELGVDFELDLQPLVLPDEASDGVVPRSSAHGESTLGRRVVTPLIHRSTTQQEFDHFRAGTDATASGEGDQRIQRFAAIDILPVLQDHFVVRERPLQEDQIECPTATQTGRIRENVAFDFKAMNGGVTGVALVTYAEDEDANWHIVHGADPTSGELDSELLLPFEGNSLVIPANDPEGLRVLEFDEDIPAGIDAQRLLTLTVMTGRLSPHGNRAPAEPTERDIESAEDRGRIHECSP